MKKLIPILVACIVLLSLFSLYKAYQSTNLVYVDVNKLLESYKRTEIVRSEFEKKQKLYNPMLIV